MSFFLLPVNIVILLLTVCVTALLFQILLLINDAAIMNYAPRHHIRPFLDIALCLYLLVWIRLIALYLYHLEAATLCLPVRPAVLYILWAVISGLALYYGIRSGKKDSFTLPVILFFLLPVSEKIFPWLYPGVLPLPAVFLLFRALRGTLLYRQIYQNTLSAFSLKEAIDGMDFALLLFRDTFPAPGQVLLCNNKMHQLIIAMTDEDCYNGADFDERLRAGRFNPNIRKETFQSLPVYHLPDGTIWQFQQKTLSAPQACRLIAASEITEIFHATETLRENREELQERKNELESMLKDLDSICRQEEILDIKGRVHDFLGHRISLILRTLREHRRPDKASLSAFSRSLMTDLKNPIAPCDCSFQRLKKDFETLGVTLHTEGDFPKNPELKKTLYDICLEASSNAVRHGYATDIHITIHDAASDLRLVIINNGITADEPVKEGGGLKGMRQKVQDCSGTFAYKTSPDFTITITIPKGVIS